MDAELRQTENIPQTYEESQLNTSFSSMNCLFCLPTRHTKIKTKVTSCARAFCIIMYSEIKGYHFL